MNDLNNKFSIRRVMCLFSYYSKQSKEMFLYLPLIYLFIGIFYIIRSVWITNPDSILNNDPSIFVNVTNFYEQSWRRIFMFVFYFFFIFQFFSIITKKERSTFFRSIPATALEKFSFLILEYIYIILLVISIHIFCIFLDGMVCALYGYNEWSDILPAIQSYFTPELHILNNGNVDFGLISGKLLDESWMDDNFYVWGVSFRREMISLFYILFPIGIISSSKYHLVISEKQKKKIKSNSYYRIQSIIMNIFFIILIFYFWSKMEANGFIFGSWCYNYKYGWAYLTLVMFMMNVYWIYLMYVGIKNGEAR
jgi:hypothetical protein